MVKHKNLVSMSGMAAEEEKENKITRYQFTKSRNKMFGAKPTNKDPNSQGLIGSQKSVWAIKLPGFDNYRHLTEEENELFNNLIIKGYGEEPEKVKARELLLDYCIKEQKSAAEYAQMLNEQSIDFYTVAILPFKSLTGKTITTATQHQIDFSERDDLTKNQKAYREMLIAEIARLNNEMRKNNL